MWHWRGIFVAAHIWHSIVNKCCSWSFPDCVCSNIGIYMYITVVVQWNMYVQCHRNICLEAYANNVNICISGLLVTLLIFVSSYKAYIYIDLFF